MNAKEIKLLFNAIYVKMQKMQNDNLEMHMKHKHKITKLKHTIADIKGSDSPSGNQNDPTRHTKPSYS